MRYNRSSLFAAAMSLFSAAVIFAACTDGDPVGPSGPRPVDPATRLATLECRAVVSDRTVSCTTPQGAASGDVLLGNQGVNVKLTSQAVQVFADTFAFQINVKNLIPQRIGVDSTGSASSNGVRVFFANGPNVTATNAPGSASVTVANADGVDLFTGSAQDYFRYAEVLDSGSVSAWKTWKLQFTPNVQTFSFLLYVSAPVQYPQGTVDVSPTTALLLPADSVQLTALVRNYAGNTVPGAPVNWASSNNGVATVDANGKVHAVASGVDTITATSQNRRPGRAIITVNTPVVVQSDSFSTLGNVTFSAPAPGVLANDSDPDGGSLLHVVPGTFATTAGGTVTFSTNGSFVYNGPAGFNGSDNVTYRATDGFSDTVSANLRLKSSHRYWYVKQGTAAAGDGRDIAPFSTLAAAGAASSAADSILVLEGSVAPAADDNLAMKAGQSLIGQTTADSIIIAVNSINVRVLPAGTTGGTTITRPGSGAAVTLSTNNTIQRLRIVGASGAAVTGSSFTTFSADHVKLHGTGGPALSLTTGAASVTADSLVSTGSSSTGLFLSGVTGSVSTTAGSIVNAAGGGVVVDGGSVNLTYPGSASQGSASALVSVSGGHTGTLTFSGGTLSASVGTGLQFSNADGTYNFNGTTTLAGGDAGIDILAGSGGNFSFAAGTSVTSPTGTAFVVNGSTPSVVYSGSLTQGNSALLVDVTDQASGTVTFQTGTLDATAGAGIQLNNADGTVNFNGTTTLHGGDAGVDVLNGSGGTFAFVAGTSITNPSGTALNVASSAPTLLGFAGSISANAGKAVAVNGASSCGTINVTGSINSSGDGILVQNCTAGAVTFSNASKTLTTGANKAVQLASNTGAAVRFTGGGLVITTTSGNGLEASGGGTVEVSGNGNTVASTGGTAVSLTSVALDSVRLQSVSATGGANGILLSSATGPFTVTGTGTAASGGRIMSTTGHAVSLSGSTAVSLTNMAVQGGTAGNAGIFGSSFGTLTVAGDSVGTNGGPALSLLTGTLNGTFSVLSSASSASNGVILTSVAGTASASSGTITGAASTAFAVSGGTLGFTYSGNVSQANNAALVAVSGAHSGTLTFDTGTLNATNGPGLQFNDADGTYSFNGTTTLNGTALSGKTAVDVVNGSSGNFGFASGTSITSPTDSAFVVTSSTPNITYSGAITQANNFPMVALTNTASGTITFQTGTLQASNGTGVQLSNADNTVNFNGTTSLIAGGDAGVDITNGSSGTITFGSGTGITNPTGTGLAVNASTPGLTYNGNITKAGTSPGALVDVTGQASGTITFQTGTLSATSSSGTSTGIQLSDVDGTVNFTGLVTLNGGDAGIDVLSGSAGTISFPSTTTITNPTNEAIKVNGSSPTFTYSGRITKTNGSTGVTVSSNSGGSVNLGSRLKTVTATGANTAVNLATNGTMAITSTDSLQITSATGNGYNATGGGTVMVQGAQNTISSVGGIALNVSSTTIGASGLTFRSISANGGSNGISLSSTGTLGGLTVTGDGSTNSSGGTIANSTGADGASAGNGVYLSSAQKVNLSWMALSGHANHAVYGTSAKDVNLNHVRITGNNGTSNSGTFQEGAVHMVNATGGITVKNSRLDGSAYTAFLVEQLSGAPSADSVVAAFDTVSTGQGSTADARGDALQAIVTSGSANVRYRNNSVTYWWNTGIQVAVQNTAASSTALIQNNKVNQTSGSLGASGGIEVNGGPLAFNISGNNITGADGTAISADKNQGNTFFNGTIDGNTIGTSGVTNSGSATGTGIFVQHAGPNATTVKISNNTIKQINGSQAIWMLLGDDTGGGGAGTLNATITGNNIAEEGSAATVRTGIVIQSGRVTGDTDQACYDVSSNSITNFNTRIRPNQRFNTVMRLPGYTGTSGDNTAVNTYMQNRNAGTTAVTSTSTAGGGGIFNTSPAGSACPQPTL